MQEKSGRAIRPLDRDEAARLVVAASGAAVEQIAPHEVEVFGEIAQQWLARTHGHRRSAPGSSVGFGVQETLLSVIALQAVSGAISEVLVQGANTAGRSWLRWLRRTPPPAPIADGHPTELTAEQSTLLREACHRHAVTLGLAPSIADVLADAIIGKLAAAPDTP